MPANPVIDDARAASGPPRAMVLAAGRGERMRPLTDHCPKPLLEVGGRPLIVWSLLALRDAGVREVVINHAHLGSMIVDALGDGAGFGLSIRYSAEASALETAGGIATARPLLGEAPFLLVNADVYCEIDYRVLVRAAGRLAADDLGLCVLVPNPDHHPGGDFGLSDGRVRGAGGERLTYAGIALLRPAMLDGIAHGQRAALGPLLHEAARNDRLAGLRFDGHWRDVGTPARLHELDSALRARGAPPNGSIR
ncbi:MAG: nucleotidyltransferase family protein [Burkholderiaceae bacterium]